jgi:hypothetical protein
MRKPKFWSAAWRLLWLGRERPELQNKEFPRIGPMTGKMNMEQERHDSRACGG